MTVPKGKTKTRNIPASGELLTHLKANAKDKIPDAGIFDRAGRQWKKEGWRDEIKAASVGEVAEGNCA